MEIKSPPIEGKNPPRLSGNTVDGDTVRKLREELRMSQREFAEFIGLSSATIATWERRNKLSAAGAVLVREANKKTAAQRQAIQKVIEEGMG